MKNYLNKSSLKLLFGRFLKNAALLFLIIPVEKTIAQTSRIAIINLADSTLIYKHTGYTLFKNGADIFDCQFNSKSYIDEELTRILSLKYSVRFQSIPNSLLSPNGSIYNSADIKKEIKIWISNLKDQFDYIIFIETGEQEDLMDPKKQKLKASGLYSRGDPTKSWVAVFSTINFTLIRTSNSETIDYERSNMEYLLPIKEYQFSRENLLIDPEMLPVIKEELTKLLDYKLEYFLSNSFLVSIDDYNSFK